MISSVWINESGEIESTYYRYENEKNKLVFTCENDTSFHWASCIYIEGNKGADENTGFLGNITVYTVNKNITKNNEIHFNAFTEDEE